MGDNNTRSGKIGRRGLLKVLGPGVAAGALAGARSAQAQSTEGPARFPRVRVGALDSIAAQPQRFSYPDERSPCFAVALKHPAEHGVGPDQNIVAYSALCPHKGCPIDGVVKPETAMAGPCPCHFSCFDLSQAGLQIQGQSTEDLAQVILDVKEGELFAVGVRGLIYGRLSNLDER